MPFKSQAQRKLFLAKIQRGEMSQETFDRWESETVGKLPEVAPSRNPAKIGRVGKIKRIARRK